MGKFGWRFPRLDDGEEQGINDGGIATFKGSELYDNLAREICQNSLDAKANEENAVVVEFKSLPLKKSNYSALVGLDDIFTECEDYWSQKSEPKLLNFFDEAKSKLSKEYIDFLVISDYNTKGLSGAKAGIREKSVWRALTHSNGVTQKEQGSGGSYGIGKNAPFACSSFRTIFYNTYAKEDNVKAFQGVARLVTHFQNGEATQGVGFYNNLTEKTPIFENDICMLRDQFRRDKFGTDVIIAGFKKTETWAADIEKAILSNFFVAIIEKKLVVKIDGQIIDDKTLQNRLKYYSEIEQREESKEKKISTIMEFYSAVIAPDNKLNGSILEKDDVILLEMFNMYANGAMAKDIIDVIEQRGITHNGKKFLPNAIYVILHNQKYIGKYEIHGKVYLNIYPPIVPLDIFEQVQRRIEHNRIGQVSRETVFLLKGKIFCGYCGKPINGESGTSHTGKVMYYYKCVNKKRNTHNCHKQTVRQDVLEQKVLDMAMELFTTKVNLDIIADEIMRIHAKHRAEQSTLKLLREDKAKAEKSLNNIMLAIEEGIINATTKNRMAELERHIDELSGKILIEESKLENSITREEVMEYLTDSVTELSPQVLIDILVNRIELYDDEIVVWFNYSDRTNPDDPDTDSRDFLLPENYSVSVTSRFVIASKKIAL